jgi:hypothetical protein
MKKILTAILFLLLASSSAYSGEWLSATERYEFSQTVSLTIHFADPETINKRWQEKLTRHYGSLEAAKKAGENIEERTGFAYHYPDRKICEVWMSENPHATVFKHEVWGHCFNDKNGRPNIPDNQ